MSTQPRRFHLQRTVDITGVSGTGRVADGILWTDSTASVRWLGDRPSTVHWDTLDDALHVHGHGGHTRIVWDDPEQPAPDMDCPHCPDGHTLPTSGSQPWSAWVAADRDGDGQPTHLIVARSAGAHVAESDADWVRLQLNGPDNPLPAAPPRQTTYSRRNRGA
ncbi:hypothetical protein ACIQPQ_31465 [Streptomyces sp. NPDC091281]|uniref:hypothetical protein n=1 Tax=Streptomyces sp. NPDC091281 TaxID=3365985 RepID=UPI00380A6232